MQTYADIDRPAVHCTTQHRYCAGVSRRSAAGNCELRTCLRSLRGGQSGSRTHDSPVESFRLNQCATTSQRPHVYVYCIYSPLTQLQNSVALRVVVIIVKSI